MAFLANTPVPTALTTSCSRPCPSQLTILFSFTAEWTDGVAVNTSLPPLALSVVQATVLAQPCFVLSGMAPFVTVTPSLTGAATPSYSVYLTYPFYWYGDWVAGTAATTPPIVNKSYVATDVASIRIALLAAWTAYVQLAIQTAISQYLNNTQGMITTTLTLLVPFRATVV